MEEKALYDKIIPTALETYVESQPLAHDKNLSRIVI